MAHSVVGVRAALQHMAKAVNIAFQSDYGENYLESVYQAAIVRNGEVQIVHREFFGYRDNWFGQFGRLLESMSLSFEGPDPASPEGRQRFLEKGPASIRGLFNLIGRKLDLVTEFEDRVPAYVEQMFDRLEASGIIVGWNRDDWTITTTTIGLDVRIKPTSPRPPRPSDRSRRGSPRLGLRLLVVEEAVERAVVLALRRARRLGRGRSWLWRLRRPFWRTSRGCR